MCSPADGPSDSAIRYSDTDSMNTSNYTYIGLTTNGTFSSSSTSFYK